MKRPPKPLTVPRAPDRFVWPDDRTVPVEACVKCLEPVFTVPSRVGSTVFLVDPRPTSYPHTPFVLDPSVGARWSTPADAALPRLARHECASSGTDELPFD